MKRVKGVRNKNHLFLSLSSSLFSLLLLSLSSSLFFSLEKKVLTAESRVVNFFNHSSSHLPHFFSPTPSILSSIFLSFIFFSLSFFHHHHSLSFLSIFISSPSSSLPFCNHRFIIWNKKDFK